MKNEPTPALTTADVMLRLNVRDPETVHQLVRSKRLRAVRFKRQYRFTEAAVAEFLNGGPAPEPVTAAEDAMRAERRRPAALKDVPRTFRR